MVGRNVRRLRIAAGLSQAELAERMGVDRAYVSGLELGRRNPTILTLWHIAKALGVKLQTFFDEEKPIARASVDRAVQALKCAIDNGLVSGSATHMIAIRFKSPHCFTDQIFARSPLRLSSEPPRYSKTVN